MIEQPANPGIVAPEQVRPGQQRRAEAAQQGRTPFQPRHRVALVHLESPHASAAASIRASPPASARMPPSAANSPASKACRLATANPSDRESVRPVPGSA